MELEIKNKLVRNKLSFSDICDNVNTKQIDKMIEYN